LQFEQGLFQQRIPMHKSTVSLLLFACLQGCVVTDAERVVGSTGTADVSSPATELVLPLVDAATYRLGRATGLVDADRITFADEHSSFPAAEVLGDFELAAFSYVDVAISAAPDAGWLLDVTPGQLLHRQPRGGSFCSNWELIPTYHDASGTVTYQMICKEWRQY
jgi:hypothetical protein